MKLVRRISVLTVLVCSLLAVRSAYPQQDLLQVCLNSCGASYNSCAASADAANFACYNSCSADANSCDSQAWATYQSCLDMCGGNGLCGEGCDGALNSDMYRCGAEYNDCVYMALNAYNGCSENYINALGACDSSYQECHYNCYQINP